MRDNIPPMGPGDRETAPWNEVDPESDPYPQCCRVCGFEAATPEEVTDHTHGHHLFERCGLSEMLRDHYARTDNDGGMEEDDD